MTGGAVLTVASAGGGQAIHIAVGGKTVTATVAGTVYSPGTR